MRPSMCRTVLHLSLVALSSLTAASCGPLFESPPDTAGLNPAFNNQWSGTWTITLAGGQPSNRDGALSTVLTSDGHSLIVSPVCPGGGPDAVNAFQDGTESAHWTGSLVCPAISFGTCSSEVFTVKYVNALLLNNRISVLVQGSVTGCGATSAFDMTFTGV